MGPQIDVTLNRFEPDGTQTVFAVSPFGASETRAERIARWEADGVLDPDCPGCWAFYAHPTLAPFAPRHKALSSCQSGKRPHCTCPACWG